MKFSRERSDVCCESSAIDENEEFLLTSIIETEQTAIAGKVKLQDQRARGPTSSRVAECRQFQKTRSFSAVEEVPEKSQKATVVIDRPPTDSSGPYNLPPKDMAFSKSEQFDLQLSQRRPGTDSKTKDSGGTGCEEPSNSNVSPVAGNETSECRGSDGRSNRLEDDLASGQSSGGTGTTHLIMQFDYFSDGQPMSLQHDSSFSRTTERVTVNQLGKSGQDLTEMETEVTRCGLDGGSGGSGFGRIKGRASNSRPRLISPLTSTSSLTLFQSPIQSLV